MSKRIINVLRSFKKIEGGTVTAVIELSHIFASLKAEIKTVACAVDEKDDYTLVAQTSFPRRFTFSSEATDLVRDNATQHSLVILHGIWAGLYYTVGAWCHRAGVPFIVIPHGSLDPFDLQKKAFLKRIIGPLFVRRILDRARLILCSSREEADLLETYGSKTERYVLPWPVNPAKIQEELPRNVCRAEFGFGAEDFVVVFMSRVDYKKGIPLLLAACKRAVQEIPNLRLVIAGAGSADYEKQMRQLLHGQSQVTVDYLGFVDGARKESLLMAADVFALLSDNENFGFSTIEALQHGLPCLISDQVYIHGQLAASKAVRVVERVEGAASEALVNLARGISQDVEGFRKAAILTGMEFAPQALLPAYRELLHKVSPS